MTGHGWRKSSRSPEGTSGNCVELRRVRTGGIAIRDSKNVEAGHLSLDVTAFAALVSRIKDDELN